ncbi:MAG TPA: MFS transporter [Pyrinomonadaceae bacterium]|nr:MFS transporter [Pyrinomonadaceae bacterium]
MTALTYRELLAGNRSFRWLWAGQVVSELGNWFNFIAGLGLVRAVTGAAPEATAILVVLRLAPFAIFAPLAGALVDRLSRRTVMIVSDAARALFALGFLFVRTADDLWIAYACTLASTLLAALFDGARNASVPNVAGERGLLAANALMFSSRFLLMTIGSALGGAATLWFGYEIAFVVNALSFIVSAYTVWLIREEDTREAAGADGAQTRATRTSFLADVAEGWRFIARHPLVAAIIGINILWATGGGSGNLIYERLGGVVFAGRGGLEGDAGVAAVYTAVGAGLFLGMILARRVGAHVELRGRTAGFMGWTIILHGLLFAAAGLMPSLWLACLMLLLSRVIIGVEFAVQETLLMRLMPDRLRGRVSTTDRAAEIMMMSVSTVAAGWLLKSYMTPRALTVVSGLLSASPGVLWLLLFAAGRLKMPRTTEDFRLQQADSEADDGAATIDESASVIKRQAAATKLESEI